MLQISVGGSLASQPLLQVLEMLPRRPALLLRHSRGLPVLLLP
jgi:hypothetical protein